MLTLILAGRHLIPSVTWMFSCGSGNSALWVCLQVQLKAFPNWGSSHPCESVRRWPKASFGGADHILFLHLSTGYMNVFNLRKFVKWYPVCVQFQ